METYKKAMEINPKEKAYPFNLGRLYFQKLANENTDPTAKAEYLKACADAFGRVIELDPSMKEAYDYKSNCEIMAKNYEDAKRLLKLQSGSKVSIITCMIYKSVDKEMIDTSSTEYIFHKFDESDLKKYLESELWKGKAGAIMVEGFAKKYIKEVNGFESTAMGLCIERLKEIISSKEGKKDNFV